MQNSFGYKFLKTQADKGARKVRKKQIQEVLKSWGWGFFLKLDFVYHIGPHNQNETCSFSLLLCFPRSLQSNRLLVSLSAGTPGTINSSSLEIPSVEKGTIPHSSAWLDLGKAAKGVLGGISHHWRCRSQEMLPKADAGAPGQGLGLSVPSPVTAMTSTGTSHIPWVSQPNQCLEAPCGLYRNSPWASLTAAESNEVNHKVVHNCPKALAASCSLWALSAGKRNVNRVMMLYTKFWSTQRSQKCK